MENLNFNELRNLLKYGSTVDEDLFNIPTEDVVTRGSIKKQTFKLPFKVELAKKLTIYYIQNNVIILKKTLNDIKVSDFDKSLIYFNLTEEETFLMDSKYLLDVQMKVLLQDDSIIISEKNYVKVVDTLDNSLFNSELLQYVVIEADVNLQEVKTIKTRDIYSNSEDAYLCKFNYDSSWDKFSKTISFKTDWGYKSDPINGNTQNICVIPKEALSRPGTLYVGVVGWYDTIKRPTSWSNGIRIDKSCDETMTSVTSGSGLVIPYATETVAGIMKLYSNSGSEQDGSINQNKITSGFNSIRFDVSPIDPEEILLKVDF